MLSRVARDQRQQAVASWTLSQCAMSPIEWRARPGARLGTDPGTRIGNECLAEPRSL